MLELITENTTETDNTLCGPYGASNYTPESVADRIQ